jgi:hypothetical protein
MAGFEKKKQQQEFSALVEAVSKYQVYMFISINLSLYVYVFEYF